MSNKNRKSKLHFYELMNISDPQQFHIDAALNKVRKIKDDLLILDQEVKLIGEPDGLLQAILYSKLRSKIVESFNNLCDSFRMLPALPSPEESINILEEMKIEII